jgi:nitroreductase
MGRYSMERHEFVDLVRTAVLAPSMHNTQPWRFRLLPDGIEVLADPQRMLPVADRSGWATRIACGAALFNLRLALAVRGTPAEVRLLPEPGDPWLIARLRPAAARPPTPAERRLYDMVPKRHSNRAPFLERPVPVEVRARLVAAARTEDAWMDLLTGPAAVEVAAELAHTAQQTLDRDDAYRAELAAWTRAEETATDGVPVATDGVPVAAGGPAPRPYDLLPRRDFGGRELAGLLDYEREPLVAVLGTAGDWPADQVQSGQALQRVLLTATEQGLATAMLSQPIEVPAVREQVRLALRRRGAPQLLLRFGYALTTHASPRRPVEDVLLLPE